MRTVRSRSVNPSSKMPEIGMPWLVSASGAAEGAAAPALGVRADAAASNVGVALETGGGALLGGATGTTLAVALGIGVALGVPPWISGSDGPSAEPTIST